MGYRNFRNVEEESSVLRTRVAGARPDSIIWGVQFKNNSHLLYGLHPNMCQSGNFVVLDHLAVVNRSTCRTIDVRSDVKESFMWDPVTLLGNDSFWNILFQGRQTGHAAAVLATADAWSTFFFFFFCKTNLSHHQQKKKIGKSVQQL